MSKLLEGLKSFALKEAGAAEADLSELEAGVGEAMKEVETGAKKTEDDVLFAAERLAAEIRGDAMIAVSRIGGWLDKSRADLTEAEEKLVSEIAALETDHAAALEKLQADHAATVADKTNILAAVQAMKARVEKAFEGEVKAPASAPPPAASDPATGQAAS